MRCLLSCPAICRIVAFSLLLVLFIFQRLTQKFRTEWITIGEYFHAGSFILFVDLVVYTNKGLKGISVKTQILFLLVHWFRYIDSFFETHGNTWILALKIFYLAASTMAVLCMIAYRDTYERSKDTCSIYFILIISIVLSTTNFIVSSYVDDGAFKNQKALVGNIVVNYLWTLSHYLQGFAMLPQFIFIYRDGENDDKLLTSYILMLGCYRVAYCFNWIERAITENFYYLSGPIGLIILSIFLTDFLIFKISGRSLISAWVLRIDDTVENFQQPLLRHIYGPTFDRVPLPTNDAISGIRIARDDILGVGGSSTGGSRREIHLELQVGTFRPQPSSIQQGEEDERRGHDMSDVGGSGGVKDSLRSSDLRYHVNGVDSEGHQRAAAFPNSNAQKSRRNQKKMKAYSRLEENYVDEDLDSGRDVTDDDDLEENGKSFSTGVHDVADDFHIGSDDLNNDIDDVDILHDSYDSYSSHDISPSLPSTTATTPGVIVVSSPHDLNIAKA